MYTRKYTKKFTPKRRMTMKKKTVNSVRSRRYRPKRTYRRKYRRTAVGEGHPMFGYAKLRPGALSQVFVVNVAGNDNYFDQSGNMLTPGSFSPIRATVLAVNPDDAIGLSVREGLNKHWRIKYVQYEFYKDAISANNGAIATANYEGSFDMNHSKAIYDSINIPAPITASGYSDELDLWLTQQKGTLLNTLSGKYKKVYCPAMINKRIQLKDGVGNYQGCDQLIKFPWLNNDTRTNATYTTGQLTCYVPLIRIKPLLGNTFDINNKSDRLAIAQKFQWLVRTKIRWEVKGKYYKDELATRRAPPIVSPEDLLDDLKLSDDESMDNRGHDVCGNYQ